MNLTLLNVLMALPALVTAIETTWNQPGSGPEKLQAVLAAVAPMIPAANAAEWLPKITMYINALVSVYNLVKYFRK